MARKKMRRFAGGGQSTDIVVEGVRPSKFRLEDFQRARGSADPGVVTGGGGGGGGGSSQRVPNLGPAPMPPREQMPVNPAVIRQRASDLGRLMGDRGATAYGGSFRMGLAKGGKADAHEPTGGKKRNKAKKYATGGKVSSASKRADGCAVKGKTKGKMV